MVKTQIPDIVVGRLPRYLQALIRLREEGIRTTSSHELGEKLGISAAQIRKDLSQFGEFGKQGTGYSIDYLVDKIQEILKVKQIWDIALVGAGDLAHAIVRYPGFTNRGFRVAMVFDNDPAKIGTRFGTFTVQDSNKLIPMIQKANILVAMLAVPTQVAQSVADQLIKAGIKAILNYAPTPLNIPTGIYVEYIDPLIQLQHMTYYL